MATIQEVGRAILSNTPDKLYVFGGEEYGLKQQYLNRLKAFYGDQSEAETVEGVLQLFRGRRLVPLMPTLYVIRYDDKFIASLSDKTAAMVEQLNIVGTVVCIYQSEKDVQKCMKYLPNYTVRLDKVDAKYVVKYLSRDFPTLNPQAIQNVVAVTSDYSLASNICSCLQFADSSFQVSATPSMIAKAFGYQESSSESSFKLAIAARNFEAALGLIDSYESDTYLLFYTILSTMLELEKLVNHKFGDSPLLPYVDLWNLHDIYYMFNNTFMLLQQSRKYSVDPSQSLVLLFSLLRVSPIPNMEDYSNGVY